MQCIFKVGWKDLSHEVQSRSVHRQMIQLKGDLRCECHLQWVEVDNRGND